MAHQQDCGYIPSRGIQRPGQEEMRALALRRDEGISSHLFLSWSTSCPNGAEIVL